MHPVFLKWKRRKGASVVPPHSSVFFTWESLLFLLKVFLNIHSFPFCVSHMHALWRVCQRKKELVLPYWFYYQWIKSILGIVSFRMRCDFFLSLYDESPFFSKNLIDCGFEMRRWTRMDWERLIFNGLFLFCSNTQFWKMAW